MSTSLAAAEKAAIEGEGQEWDTQMCIEVQEEFLSSPVRTPGRHGLVASSTRLPISLTNPKSPAPWNEHDECQIEANIQLEFGDDAGADHDHYYESDDPDEPNESSSKLKPSKSNDHANPPTIYYKRDATGKLRPFTSAGEEKLPSGFEEKYQRTHQAVMEDLTQKSSMSLTQENSESVYEKFNHGKPQEDYPSTATPDSGLLPTQANADSLHSRYASARTESTAVTYQEDDPRHIRVDFNMEIAQEIDEEELEETESQDGSFAAPQADMVNNSYDPQTPAPPINPFITKGSVMKGFELFGATQPSSIGRCLETPASGRPSPNVYNDYSSPPKRRRVMSSPLNFAGVEAETSPLQSSVRKILIHSASMESPSAPVFRASDFQSSDIGIREPVNEPRAYVSMKESQERRNKKGSTPETSDSDSDDFDDDIPTVPRRQKIETALQKELSAVELRKKVASSRTSSAHTPTVEVPSTRRSAQDDEYAAQRERRDGQDGQQIEETQSQDDEMDDVIVDSQALPTLPQASSALSGEQSPTRQDLPSLVHSQLEDANVAMPNLPIHEDSSNGKELQTPTGPKLLGLDVDTVPETSPPNEHVNPARLTSTASSEERLRPMGEIASLSYSVDDEVDFLDDMPGLTQDIGFEKARTMGGSSPVPARIRSFREVVPAEPAVCLPPEQDVSLSQMSEHEQNQQGVQNSRVPQNAEEREAGELREAPRIDRQEAPSFTPTTKLPIDSDSPFTSSLSEISTPPHPTDFFGLGHEEQSEPGTPNTVVQEDHMPSIGDALPMDNAPGKNEALSVENSGVEVNSKAAMDDITNHDLADGSLVDMNGNDVENELPKYKTTVTSAKAPLAKVSGSRKKTSKAKAPAPNPRQSSRVTKKPKSTFNRLAEASTSTTPRSSPLRNIVIPDAVESTVSSGKRTNKRISGAVPAREDSVIPTRSSKRQSLARESSEDPLAFETSGSNSSSSVSLFAKMAFAIGYVNPDKDRNRITELIAENGGTILPEGFDTLFEASKGEENTELRLSSASKQLGFTALIADEHSRKAKYMQALALGLPCLSGQWISACVSKGHIVEWAPYLLCAGMSSILHAAKSRMLSPYLASTARLEDVIATREQLLNGRSVLFVTGKSKAEVDKRKAYTFLTQVLGPTRLTRVGDLHEARKKLSDSNDNEWDMLYVDVNEKHAEKSVFGSGPTGTKSGKRKRFSDAAEDTSGPPPKKIRVIADETLVQSLIMGQLLE